MSIIFCVSDIHLSPDYEFFWSNWKIARDAANASDASLVLVAGDLCIDGADSDAEMAFAGRALARLDGRWRAIPGNHDVGDEPPGQTATQYVDATRLQRWAAVFGADRFAETIGAWRAIGINAQLLGSGLEEEAEQFTWLEQQLEATKAPVALFLHKPLFLTSPGEQEPNASCTTPEPRAKMLALLKKHGVRFVISGHLHSYRDAIIDGIRYLWLPPTSFIGQTYPGSRPIVGMISIDVSGPAEIVTLHEPEGMVPIDLVELKQHGRYAFLRDMPHCPPSEV